MVRRSDGEPPVSWRPLLGRVAGPLAFAAVVAAPPPAGMPPAAWHVAGTGAWMAIWWITEAIPIPATALLPLVLFPLLGVAPIEQAAAPYANPVIFLFMGGFIIAASLRRTGLHRRIALVIVRAVGTGPTRVVGGFMAATAFLSMWVSNTATAVMMLPIALSILALSGGEGDGADADFPVALLLGIAYAANIGGLGTIIGTPPNALLVGFMDEAYGVRIGFVQWMLVGVPLVLVALPLAWLLLTRVLHPVGAARLVGGREVIARELMALGPPSRAEWMAGGITALTAASWVLRPFLEDAVPGLSDAGIAIAGALLLFVASLEGRGAAPLLTWDDAERLPWGVLVLFGGGLSLASAIERTGLAAWIGGAMAAVGAWPIALIVVSVTTLVIFLTELTSNTATAAGFLPVVAALAVGIGVDPLLLGVPTALAASCAFMMPVATPPNAIVYGSGRLTIPQMARAGLALNLILVALITAAVLWLVPRALG